MLDDLERPFAALLIGALVEWAEGLGIPEWARAALVHSLDGGTLRRVVLQALSEARARGRRDGEHPTPVVSIEGEKPEDRPTLPSDPSIDYDDPPQTGRTSRGFPKPS